MPGFLPDAYREREFFIANLLVRIHFIIVMIRWTGLAPWEFEFPFPGSLTSTFLSTGNLDRRVAEQSLVGGARLPSEEGTTWYQAFSL